jgi:hypothetical protein
MLLSCRTSCMRLHSPWMYDSTTSTTPSQLTSLLPQALPEAVHSGRQGVFFPGIHMAARTLPKPPDKHVRTPATVCLPATAAIPQDPCCTCRTHSQDQGTCTGIATAVLHHLMTCTGQCCVTQAVPPARVQPTCAVILWKGRGLQATPASTRRWAKKGWSSMTGQGTEGMPALSTAPHVPTPQWCTAKQHLQGNGSSSSSRTHIVCYASSRHSVLMCAKNTALFSDLGHCNCLPQVSTAHAADDDESSRRITRWITRQNLIPPCTTALPGALLQRPSWCAPW